MAAHSNLTAAAEPRGNEIKSRRFLLFETLFCLHPGVHAGKSYLTLKDKRGCVEERREVARIE